MFNNNNNNFIFEIRWRKLVSRVTSIQMEIGELWIRKKLFFDKKKKNKSKHYSLQFSSHGKNVISCQWWA